MSDATENSFTTGPMATIFAKTALPIIFVMGMNGLLAVADALFLGIYVGPDALGAVTLMFPIYMLIVALATLVGSGMSSILARHLGAHQYDDARGVFAGAHGLALVLSVLLIALFILFGPRISLLAAGGSASMGEMGLIYLRITVLFSPVLFVLSVNSDALRNEGRVGFMAAMSLLVSVANIGFNYVLIALLDMGVAGSAYGTVMAQVLAFSIILTFRLAGSTELRPNAITRHSLFTAWGRILALGAPQSLNFVGLALGSAAIVTALQLVEVASYETTISAYGIVTRTITFVFLPLLGLSYALQSIVGNNFGAGLLSRSDLGLKIGIGIAFVYCLSAQLILTVFAEEIGGYFVESSEVVAEVARIMPIISLTFFVAGPLMMIASYFQAIGEAMRAAILSLTKTYIFAIPLTFMLPNWFGEIGVWIAGPLAEVCLLILTVLLLASTARSHKFGWGMFAASSEVRT